MRFQHEDELLERYLALTSRLDGRKGIDVVAIRGAYCVSCGGGPATVLSKASVTEPRPHREKDWKTVCASCLQPWSGQETPVFKGEVDMHGAAGRSEDWLVTLVSELTRLRPIVENRPRDWYEARWRWVMTAWSAHLNKEIGTYANVAREGRVQVPEFGPWWKEKTIARGIERAREIVRRRAERERLMARAAA